MKRGSQQKTTKQTKRAVWRELSGELLTQEELAVQLKVTLRTVWNWQACGILPFLRMGKCVRFYWPAVLNHLIENFMVLSGPGSGLATIECARQRVPTGGKDFGCVRRGPSGLPQIKHDRPEACATQDEERRARSATPYQGKE